MQPTLPRSEVGHPFPVRLPSYPPSFRDGVARLLRERPNGYLKRPGGGGPRVARPAHPYMERAPAWEELRLPTLKVQPPWHGYSLGEWDAAWDRCAACTVTGDLGEECTETLLRRRSETPEAPVQEWTPGGN